MYLNYNGWLLVACLWFILYRYLDEEMIFGIDGESVHSMTGALIPEVTFIDSVTFREIQLLCHGE
jgi:hypothetical protein